MELFNSCGFFVCKTANLSRNITKRGLALESSGLKSAKYKELTLSCTERMLELALYDWSTLDFCHRAKSNNLWLEEGVLLKNASLWADVACGESLDCIWLDNCMVG